jgi:hypothetical protein
VAISSPYRKIALLHTKHRDHYGEDGPVLVVQAPSITLNPTLNQELIAEAIADDPKARSEWDATFRVGLLSFLDDATIDAAIDYSRPLEIEPLYGKTYSAWERWRCESAEDIYMDEPRCTHQRNTENMLRSASG